MRIMILGSGAREHALFAAVRQSPRVRELFLAPGNAAVGEACVDLDICDLDAVLRKVRDLRVDLLLVGPELPLTLGVADALRQMGVGCFGVGQEAARLESSKAFAKRLMKNYNIPTARYEVFSDYDAASVYCRQEQYPLVIKADGLAAGKGVYICHSVAEAQVALRELMQEKRFQDAGSSVVVEEYLWGEEISAFALLDGKTCLPFAYVRDYKKRFDANRGPNTGGMGAVMPCHVSPALQKRIEDEVFMPTFQALSSEGIVYQGVLYAGLMMQNDAPKVLEFNVRFGDPEAQVIFPLLKTDFLDICDAVMCQTLHDLHLVWRSGAAVCVVLVSEGYPGKYSSACVISGLENLVGNSAVSVYHGATCYENGRVLSAGGRVLSLVGLGDTVGQARENAYAAVSQVHFENMASRSDIAADFVSFC